MFYEVDKDAMALLRGTKKHYQRDAPDEPLSERTRLVPELSAESVGLEPKGFRYERALRHLLREGALVREERLGGVPGVDYYRITERGLQMLEAS